MKTGIWRAEQKTKLYHNLKNSDEKKVVEQQEQDQFKHTFYQKK